MLKEFKESLSKYKYFESIASYDRGKQISIEFRSEQDADDFIAQTLLYAQMSRPLRGAGNTYAGLNYDVLYTYKLMDILDDSELLASEEWVIIKCPHGNDVAEAHRYISGLKVVKKSKK